MTPPIIIIGSGLAGYTLAREIRKLDPQTQLQMITADDGAYYSKPQLSSAFTHKKAAAQLAGGNAEQMAKQLNTEILTFAKVNKIDPQQQKIYLTDGREFTYAKLVLAQGAATLQPKLDIANCEKIMSVNDLLDYRRFRVLTENKKSVAILGAGLVGCEFTNDLTNGGYQVDVIALSATPLDLLLPPELGEAVKTGLEAIGVRWHFKQSIKQIEDDGKQLHLTLTNNEKITCDVLLTAIGLRPVITLAQACGLNVNRGICVDRHLQTSNANIFALGDCAEVEGNVLLYVTPLVNSARALAHTLTGNLTAVSYPPMPVIIKTPACPVVSNPPPYQCEGEWQISGEGLDKKALFFDKEKKLHGFALTGKTVSEKLTLVQQVPGLLI